MHVKWLNSAKLALDNEIIFLAQEDVDLAKKVYSHIREQVATLQNFPEMGRSGRIWGTRELVISRYSYIVPYRIKNNIVEVLTVFHTKRQLPQEW